MQHKAPPALIRAMASTLRDHDVDLLNDVEIISTLLRAGFLGKQIEVCFNSATAMALTRWTNEQRKK